MSPMPAQKPASSTQAVGTPKDFLDAVRTRLRIREFAIDLAADHTNFVCEPYFTPEVDSLQQPWHQFCGGDKGWGWLNPEFGDIYPWAEKSWQESQLGAQSVMLVPAATDTYWWGDFVRNKGYAVYLQGRITFIGHSIGYPKGLALILYAPFLHGGDCVWRWKPARRPDVGRSGLPGSGRGGRAAGVAPHRRRRRGDDLPATVPDDALSVGATDPPGGGVTDPRTANDGLRAVAPGGIR